MPRLEYPTPFWVNKPQYFDERMLAKETYKLGFLDNKSAAFLARIVNNLGYYQKFFYDGDRWSKAIDLWKSRQNEWIYWAFKRIDDFEPQELSNIIYSIAQLDTIPPDYFLKAFEKAVLRKINKFDPQQLARLVNAYAQLGTAPSGPLLEEFNKAILKKFLETNPQGAEFSNQNLTNCYWATAVFSVLSPLPKSSLDLASLLLVEIKKRDLDPVQAGACFFACLRLAPEEVPLFKSALSEDVSKLEKKFKNSLIRNGFPLHDEARTLPELFNNADYAFFIGDKRVLIELDGPHHFVKRLEDGTNQFDGGTRLMTALIEKTYPNDILIRVSFEKKGLPFLADNIACLNLVKEAITDSDRGAFSLRFFEDGKAVFSQIKSEPLSSLLQPHRGTSGAFNFQSSRIVEAAKNGL